MMIVDIWSTCHVCLCVILLPAFGIITPNSVNTIEYDENENNQQTTSNWYTNWHYQHLPTINHINFISTTYCSWLHQLVVLVDIPMMNLMITSWWNYQGMVPLRFRTASQRGQGNWTPGNLAPGTESLGLKRMSFEIEMSTQRTHCSMNSSFCKKARMKNVFLH